MTTIRRFRTALLTVAALASMAACLAIFLATPILGAVLASTSTVAILGSLAVEYRRDSSRHEALIRKAAEHAEAGRKLAIYERTTGLFAHWYIAMRGEEECNRAARYERPLTLLVVEPALGSNVWAVQGQLAEWLRSHLRAADVSGYLGNGRYLALLVEADAMAAETAIARLRRKIDCVQTGVSSFPRDGVTFDQLYAVAKDKLREPAEQAA